MNDEFSNDSNASPLENLAAPQDLWTTREVAKFLHVSIKTIFNLRKKRAAIRSCRGSRSLRAAGNQGLPGEQPKIGFPSFAPNRPQGRIIA